MLFHFQHCDYYRINSCAAVIAFIFSMIFCISCSQQHEKIDSEFYITSAFQLRFTENRSYTLDSVHFWNPESTTMQMAANGDLYGYDYYAKRLYKFNAHHQFVGAIRSVRDSAGRYYHSVTDFIINKQGEVVLYDNVSGQVVFCNSNTGSTTKTFQARSTNWFTVIQTHTQEYILASPSQMSTLPILHYYDSLGKPQGTFGEAEPETKKRMVNIIGLRKLAYCDNGDTIFVTNPAVYRIQKYAPRSEKMITFGIRNTKWRQISGLRDEEKDSSQIGSVIHLLGESQGLLLAFVMTVQPPYKVVEQWIDTYRKNGDYQGSILLDNTLYPMFIDNKGYLWFAVIEKDHTLNLSNRTIQLTRYTLQSTVSAHPSHVQQ